MNKFDQCINRQERIDKIVNIIGNSSIAKKNLLVKDKVMNPVHSIAVLGETSSGKSTLINSILNNKILVESVKPTTGIITEIQINDSKQCLIAINKDDTIKYLEKDDFDKFSINPLENMHRLKYIGPCRDKKYSNMRIFDTPGYGSLIDYHEELLKDFIPESDFIVYVVSYKVGILDSDIEFLKYVKEVIGENVEIILVINMCPKDINMDNKKVQELKNTLNDFFQINIKTFIIESNVSKEPNTEELWDFIHEQTNKLEKKEDLAKALKNYQDYILTECKIKVISKIAKLELKKEDLEEKVKITKDLLISKQEIIDIMDRGFTRIKLKAIKTIDKSAVIVKNSITEYINDESKWAQKEETYTIMEHYYIPKLTNEETDNLINYLEDELVLLQRAIENIVKEVVDNFDQKINANIPVYSEVMNSIINKYGEDKIMKTAGQVLGNLQSKYNDNVENVNIDNIKRLPKLIETYPNETDKNLNYFFRNIKANSIKAITKYLNVFKDSIFYLYDALTWKNKVNEISVGAVDNWARDLEYSVKKQIEKLNEENKKETLNLFDELSLEFEEDQKELEELEINQLIKIKTEIEFMLDKFLFITLK